MSTNRGFKIGHYTDSESATGLSVLLFDQPATCSYWLPGAAPASRELAVLDPENSVQTIDALLLTGGSAFGLGATDGVLQWLKAQNRGVQTPSGPVPIVPTAAIYDLAYISDVVPTPEAAVAACQAATIHWETGQVGAGTGARAGTLCRMAGVEYSPGGVGHASLKGRDGINIDAFAVVNCAGDVWSSNEIIAGAKNASGTWVDTQHYLLTAEQETDAGFIFTHTVLVAVCIQTQLSKAQLKGLAKTAATGIPQAVRPACTANDGDIVFAIATGGTNPIIKPSLLSLGVACAEAVRRAIVQAVSTC